MKDYNMLKNKMLQRIFLGFASVLVSIVMLEGLLRGGGLLKESFQRMRNMSSINRGGEYRILCIGESTTRGDYPAMLEQILNKKCTVKVSVINEGHDGVNTAFLADNLPLYVERYKPHMVISMMGINDVGGALEYVSRAKSRSSWRILFLWELLVRHIREIVQWQPHSHSWSSLNSPEVFSAEMHEEQQLEKEFLRNTQNVPLGIQLAHEYEKNGHTEKKIELLLCLQKIQPENSWIHGQIGLYYDNQNDSIRAEKEYRKALDCNPLNDWVYGRLGRLYSRTNKQEAARKYFIKALEINPKNNEANGGLADLYMRVNQFDEAQHVLEKAIDVDPTNEWHYIHYGLACMRMKEYNTAVEVFKKAITINPRNEWAVVNGMNAFFMIGQYAEAQQLGEDILSKGIANQRIYGMLSTVSRVMYEHEKAHDYFEKAEALRRASYMPYTTSNYRRIKDYLAMRGIIFVCMQYPMRDIDLVKRNFREDEGVFFIDNEEYFKQAVMREGYTSLFADSFAGDFGHCTEKGYMLLAQHIADELLRAVIPVHIINKRRNS